MVKDCMTRPGKNLQGQGYLSWNFKPYGPTFPSHEKADEFIQFVGNKTGLDPKHQSEERLELLAAEFRGRFKQ